ncbi:hypothetical protein C9J60_12630 [Streptomyces sp. A244]|uniref:DUF3152 domain-containing protein n=1 Tax=Streptomyces TaxID=1883 RepID=UPI000D1A66CA|nr:DUF3152 domain-containing protein [Streptomyces sp. A244]PTH87756.1 hypothetical protein C9J60_12630 [Streptomyces sp. A244]
MGRHSRRGPVAKGDSADTTAVRDGRTGAAQGQRPGQAPDAGRGARTAPPGAPQGGWPSQGPRRVPGPRPAPAEGAPPPPGMPRLPDGWHPDGTPPQGLPRLPDGTPVRGVPRLADGAAARGVPGLADGTPAHGVPRLADGAHGHGVSRLPDGTPAHGMPRVAGGTPPRGVPRLPDGTPAHGFPQARGGHPEQREAGGGWGELRGSGGAPAGVGAPIPRQRRASVPGPRQDYIDAFVDEEDDVFAPRTPASAHAADAYASVTDWSVGSAADSGSGSGGRDDARPTGAPVPGKGGKGRAFTGIAAAAVTTVLAVVVAGQVTDDNGGAGVQSQTAPDRGRDVRDSASRADGRAPAPEVKPLTYVEKMGRTYPLGAELKGSGRFDAVPGIAEAPGAGQKFTYRVDVEQGLGLDGALFAEAVQQTLNDRRSWAHDGARTFERIYSGKPDFVITLASPGTTADWCAKSGLDTTQDNVSCDSAATERVMINAYRWAQGSPTYGDSKIHAYRQMLINHEVGHRLGYNHVTCDKDGDLAPVMQQQTKFLDHDGIRCRANPWPYPGS